MSTKFERQWSPEQTADVIRRRVVGESVRSIARGYDVSPSTISRLVRQPDIAALLREEQAKATEAARGRRRRAAAAAEAAGARPEVVESLKSGKPPTQRGAPKTTADGRLLGVFGFSTAADGFEHGRWTPNRVAGGKTQEAETTPTELDALDRRINPERNALSTCVTDIGSYGYDRLDTLDLARVADLVVDDRPDLTRNDVLATLTAVEPGRTFRFPPSDDEPEEDEEE